MNAILAIQEPVELIRVAPETERRMNVDFHSSRFEVPMRLADPMATSHRTAATCANGDENLLITSRLTSTDTISVSRSFGTC